MTTRSLATAAIAVAAAACGGHRHGPSTNTNLDTLHVEIWTRGDHQAALRDGASRGLSAIPFVRRVGGGGELEIDGEVTRMQTSGRQTACSVKLLLIRLPQHDLLGIADGSARADGTDGRAEDDCVAQLTSQLVRRKVSRLLRMRLRAKR